MKKLTKLIGVAALAISAGAVTVSTAAAAPAANSDPHPWLFAYSQSNFQGDTKQLYTAKNDPLYVAGFSTQSVRNLSQSDVCGAFGFTTESGQLVASKAFRYTFWKSAEWGSIGNPFSGNHPLNYFRVNNCPND